LEIGWILMLLLSLLIGEGQRKYIWARPPA